MATLPANSTFLPVLDDLLSPDFRPFSMPGQTPQTPAETPVSATAPRAPSFGESHTGQLTGKVSFGDTKREVQLPGQVNGAVTAPAGSGARHHDLKQHSVHQNYHNSAAEKIQKWWKSRKGKARLGNGTVDIKAERVKHSIRHHRTEEHVRYLETEVHRLKSALATERKLRSLQLEAIRSLWTQVQKVSSVSSPSVDNSIMSQSMPNGLPIGSKGKDTSGIMTMSLHSGLDQQQKQEQNEVASATSSCACTKEIQHLRESLTGEMVQLRQMIDQLRVEGTDKAEVGDNDNGDQSRVLQQKRPLTLNLTGISTKDASEQVEEQIEVNVGPEKKKEIAGYADQMASNILGNATVDKEDEKE